MADDLSMAFLDGEQEVEHGQLDYSMPSYHPAMPMRPVEGWRAGERGGKARRNGIPRTADHAWVYVAEAASGAVKVGITSNPNARSKQIGARIIRLFHVVPSAAPEVENQAFLAMGRLEGDGEWVPCSVTEATAHVAAAIARVSRYKHVDPEKTPDQARKERISLAGSAQ